MRRTINLVAALLVLVGLAPLAAQDAGFSSVIRNGSAQRVRAAIAQGASPNALLPNGESPLAEAAISNTSTDVITALAHAGAAINAKDATGMTPLMWAAAENPNPDVASALLAAGAEVNARNVIGVTPLMFAAKESTNPAVVRRLLEAGAAVNADDINGMTPLMYAAADNDSPKIIAELLAAGADGRLASKAGLTAFAYAKANPSLKGTPAIAALEKGARGAFASAAPAVTSPQTAVSASPSTNPAEAATLAARTGGAPTAALPVAAAGARPVVAAAEGGPSVKPTAHRAGRLVIDIKPKVGSHADIWLAIEGAHGTRLFPNLPQNRPLTEELTAGSYRVRAHFVGDAGTGFVGTVTVVAGGQTTITIPLAYSPVFLRKVDRRYDRLRARQYRNRFITLPYLEHKRVENGRKGAVVEGLGVATAGLAGLFYYLSTTNPSSSQAYRSAAIVGGGFSGGLLVWGTAILLTRPSQGEVNRLKLEDRQLDAQIKELARIKASGAK